VIGERFAEWWQAYPLRKGRDLCAQLWLSVVTSENETAVFACLERYLISKQVADGCVMAPNNWLHDCSRDNWETDWPPWKQVMKRTPLPPPKASPAAEREALEWLAANDLDLVAREYARKKLEASA
jgi:hypothetical protein